MKITNNSGLNIEPRGTPHLTRYVGTICIIYNILDSIAQINNCQCHCHCFQPTGFPLPTLLHVSHFTYRKHASCNDYFIPQLQHINNWTLLTVNGYYQTTCAGLGYDVVIQPNNNV